MRGKGNICLHNTPSDMPSDMPYIVGAGCIRESTLE